MLDLHVVRLNINTFLTNTFIIINRSFIKKKSYIKYICVYTWLYHRFVYAVEIIFSITAHNHHGIVLYVVNQDELNC